jgi:hypothetical protein
MSGPVGQPLTFFCRTIDTDADTRRIRGIAFKSGYAIVFITFISRFYNVFITGGDVILYGV